MPVPSPVVPPETTVDAVYFSMMRDFLRSAPTVSVGCAPFASHALMAGAVQVRLLFDRVVPSKLLLVKEEKESEVSEAFPGD